MENKLHKTAKRLGSMWKASRQLQVGLILFLVVLLIAILANVLSPYDPYYLGDDLLVPPGSEGHPLGTNQMGCDLFDEWNANLDEENQKEISEYIDRLAKRGLILEVRNKEV